MNSIKEVEENIDDVNKTMEKLNELELLPETLRNLNLAAIVQMLSDISVTLAIMVEQMKGDNNNE